MNDPTQDQAQATPSLQQPSDQDGTPTPHSTGRSGPHEPDQPDDLVGSSDAVLESVAVGYLAMDADWRITHLNTAARRIVSTADSGDPDVLGHLLWQVLPTSLRSALEAPCRRAVDTAQTLTVDLVHHTSLDTWFEVRATPEPGGLALFFLDVIARQDGERTRDLAAQRLAAVGALALALTDAEDITALVTVVAEQGLAALGCDGGAVAVPDPEDPDALVSYVTASYGAGAQADYAHLPLSTALPVCEAARTGRRVLVADRQASRAYSPAMADVVDATGSQAFASVPLLAGGRLKGVLTAGWVAPQDFAADELELLETLAAQCAQALARLAARQREQDATRTAQDATRAAQEATRAAQQATALADRTAAQQAALVAIAQSLADADDQEGVLAVLDGQGRRLLGANGCGLCLREDDGATIATIVTDTYAEVRTTVQRVPADFPLPAIRAAATGQAIFLPDRYRTEDAFPGSRAIYEGAGVQASAAVPLVARGRLLGCLSIGFTEPRQWSQGDRDLLGAFAAITAQALDRIAAHEAEQAARAAEQVASAQVARFSETIQRSLLTSPATPDDLVIAVRYVPASSEAYVGGDWYDAFVTSAGVTSLVIGDVAGHDRTAAAAMGQLRNLLRGIGYTVSEPPAVVLTTLDHAAVALGVDAMATMVLATLEQDEDQRARGVRTLRWANAGHPPPLLVEPDGQVRLLQSPPDLVMGIAPDLPRLDHAVELEPGSMVLLYTDGLVERRGVGLDRGLAWLADAVGELVAAGRASGEPLGPEGLCDALLAQVGSGLEDDVALLALCARPQQRRLSS